MNLNYNPWKIKFSSSSFLSLSLSLARSLSTPSTRSRLRTDWSAYSPLQTVLQRTVRVHELFNFKRTHKHTSRWYRWDQRKKPYADGVHVVWTNGDHRRSVVCSREVTTSPRGCPVIDLQGSECAVERGNKVWSSLVSAWCRWRHVRRVIMAMAVPTGAVERHTCGLGYV